MPQCPLWEGLGAGYPSGYNTPTFLGAWVR
jgi:hypothetical protein